MQTIRITSLITRVALVAVLLLGLVFWLAQAGIMGSTAQPILRNLHMGLGVLGDIGLLVLAISAIFRREARSLAAVGILCALVLPSFGLVQAVILAGSLHWLVQIAHLLIGIGAIYLTYEIERRYRGPRLEGNRQASKQTSTLPVV
ncbi:hypothetical protein EPA93_34210 [Ktedonosporobacter rubrisoli]|uniref:Uncharacterized protein n=1 Tax=Ktedonosporobacter rubrisoli TaxID=2509675 RepID=A0A4P6JZ40_KTERU|nr:hypothetical protein [Ktedonosporobacter rubrisoli]QBD80753.1 hypothetical protein EPA93_34210 [Ktedonosporobacter rubrisoli]